MATTRDPFTGAITFKNPNQVINTVTGQTASGLQTLNTAPNVSTTMDASRLGEATPVKTIAKPIPTDTATPFVSGVSSSMDSLNEFIQSFQQPTQGEQTQTALTKRLSESLSSLEGKGARTQQLEMQAGVPENIKQLQEINLQIAQRSGEFDKLAISKEGQGRGIVSPIVSGQQAVIRRQQAIEIGALASVSQAMQGNIALAQQTAQRTVDLEFQDREQEIDNLKTQLELNRDTLTREDRKRTQQLDIVLNERSRLLQEEKSDREQVFNIGLTAQKYGADAKTAQSILEAKTPEEALLNAGSFLQDPRVQQELINAKLNTQLTKIRINREASELAIFNTYGGLTPQQYLAEKEKEEKEARASQDSIEQSKLDGMLLNDSIQQIDAVLGSSALDSIVGSTFLTRGIGRQKEGFFGKVAKLVQTVATSGIASGITDELGKSDDTVALTQQILDQQFLEKLINVKSKGATFGALSDNEGQALKNSANAISGTAIKKDEKVIGYDMSEKEFKNQMNIVKKYMQLSYERATGNLTTPEEDAYFDAMENINQSFNPSF